MRSNFFLFCLLAAVFVLACSKKNEPEIKDIEYVVRFRATGFTQLIENFSVKSRAVASTTNSNIKLIGTLYFVVFDTQGRVVKSIKQDTLKSVLFGAIELSLPAGNYRIAAVGAPDEKNTGQAQDYTMQIESLDKFRISFIGNVKHVFCSELFPFEVNADTSLEKELFLKRVSSQLDVIFDNVIPENAHYVVFEIPSIVGYNFFGQNQNNFAVKYRKEFGGLKGTSGVKFSIPIFGGEETSSSPKDLKISFYDQDDTVILTRSISNIRFEKNKITEVKGNIFEDPKNPFAVKISSNFDGQFDFIF